MRSALRSLSVAACAVALAGCVDAFRSVVPAGSRTSLTVVPRFTESASLASATLAAAGLEYDHARIVIVRPESDTLKDTTIVFTPSTAQVTLELSVAATPGESLTAGLQFRQGDVVIFSGTAETRAIAPSAATSSAPLVVQVNYAGPGAAATSVQIAQDDGVYSASDATQFSAQALDASGEALADAPIFWSVSDESKATISATGLLSPNGQRGTVEVMATTAVGVADTVQVRLAPPAAGLRVVQGASQRGPANSTLPLPVIVEAFAADGLPAAAAGRTVTFSASAGAQISPASAVLDANSRAQATMQVGGTPGTTYLFSARVGTDSVTWGGTAAAGTPTHFVPSGSTTLEFRAGEIPDPVPTLRVADALENSVAGVLLRITIEEGGVVTEGSPFQLPADSLGRLAVYRIAPTRAGTYTILVEAADPALAIAPVTYTVKITPAAAAKLVFVQQPPGTVTSGHSVTIKVAIQDQFSNTVTSANSGFVNLHVNPDGDADWNVAGTGSVTPVNGIATFTVQVTTTSGAKTGVRLQAIGVELPAVLSDRFDITP